MDFTKEQFKEWIAETFPDNTARLIAENNFRDGLNAMADFVFQTNSSAFIQESIAQVASLEESTQAAALVAAGHVQAGQSVLSQTEAVAGTTEGYMETVLQTKEQIDQNSVLARIFVDSWNIATATPNVAALTLNNTTDKGKFYKVAAGGGGVTSITGTAVTASEGDEFTWNGTKWVYTKTPIADKSVTTPKLSNEIASAIPGAVEIYGDKYPLVKTPSGRMLLWHYVSGLIAGKFDLSISDIPFDRLPDVVKNGTVNSASNELTDIWPIAMSANKRMFIYGRKDGSVHIPKLVLKNGSIGLDKFSPEVTASFIPADFKRILATNPYDVAIEDDGLRRGNEFSIPVKTSPYGIAFNQLPLTATKVLKGLNDTGTDLVFRQTCSLPIRGTNYRGEFDPTASGISGTNFRGMYGDSLANTYPAFPAGATGDCWVIDCGDTVVTKTANGLTFKNGDMLVKTLAGYAIQPGPGDGTYNEALGEFWNVTNSGYFGGKYYGANSRIYILGLRSNAGPKYIYYGVSKPGELYTMGECGAGFAPSGQREGDLYVFSQDAAFDGLTGKTNDHLIYMGGWGISSGQTVIVPSGKSFFLPCSDASEWCVRRADKSTAVVTVNATGHRTTVRLKTTDELFFLSDSMFGGGSTGSKILSLAGRAGAVRTFGGGSSNYVMAMFLNYIQTTDENAGKVHILWHGQNNLSDAAQIKNASNIMSRLIGSRDARFVFWSVLGTRSTTWDGSRLVATTQEGGFNGTNVISEIEKFYEFAFKYQYFSPRKALLKAAESRTGIPDILHPGKTEAETAALYGHVPVSFFFDFSGKPFTAASLVFAGYRSAAGLPAGGANNDYYLRTGGGTIGNVIVNIAGTWTEYNWDRVHVSSEGGQALADQFVPFLNLHNL